MLSQQRKKLKKTVSEPNLFVVRNGKLCQRTPKNANGTNQPTTKVVHLNHTINHLISASPSFIFDNKGRNSQTKGFDDKKQSKDFFNGGNDKQDHSNKLSSRSNANISYSKRIILNSHVFGQQTKYKEKQQSSSGLNFSNNQKFPVKNAQNSKQNEDSKIPQKVNYYQQTIQQLKKQMDRLRTEYRDLERQYWNSLNEKLQIISQNSLVQKYQDKVEQCLRAVQKIEQSGLEIPKSQMSIHRHNFVFNRLQNLKKNGNSNANSARFSDSKRLFTQDTKGKFNKDKPVSNSIILSETSIKLNSHDQQLDRQTDFTSQKNINTVLSVNQTSQEHLRYLLQYRVKILQSLAYDIIKEHKQLLQKLVFFKDRTKKFQTQIVSMKQEHSKTVKKIEDELFYFKTEHRNNGSNVEGLKIQLKRKQQLIESLVKRIKTKAQQDYGYHYLK